MEVAAARQLLRCAAVGLVTLTGAGGSGKTRLALHVAAEMLPEFAHGVFFVGLAPLRDPGLVLATIAQPLGVQEESGTPLLERLKEYVRDKQLLLLLDNFEQVLDAAPLVSELLAAAPRLKALVSSRTALRLQGEKEFSVPPLAVPAIQRAPGASPGAWTLERLNALAQNAAVALFTQRAQDVKPEFALTRENAGAVAEICVRLDGLPLAIELAAARIKILPPQALLARLVSRAGPAPSPTSRAAGVPAPELGGRLPLLVGGARDLPARQQTLRDTISWSYDLLAATEQALLRRLSIFVGGCTLEAAEAVCSHQNGVVLEGVASLVDQSLLHSVEAAEPRFLMLEAVREYALECLVESGEVSVVRQQHAEFFVAWAEREGKDPATRCARLESEQDNLRAALAWCREDATGGELGLRLAGMLGHFWEMHGLGSEGRQWLAGALAHPGAADRTAARGGALFHAGNLAA
jgi:predicted ATPase